MTPATQMLILAVLVGVLGGFGALFFKKLILVLQGAFWNTPNMASETLLAVSWYRRLLIPMVGGLIVGPLIYFLAREARGPGVPEVMIAVIVKNSIIRPIVVLVKILASAICIGSGGSVGREGPIVQIGAAIASTTGQILRLSPVQLKTLVGCGVAAGISATFNAPIAGALFSLELIVSDFGLTPFTPILVASVSAAAITRHFHGNVIEFVDLPQFTMISHKEFAFYLILGVAAGFVGFLFSRSIYRLEDIFNKTKIPQWIRPAVGGLIVGIIALKFPHIMGVGYDTIDEVFSGTLVLNTMLFLVILKILATSVTLGSGGSGGVFAPSLFIGAMLGGAFGTIFHKYFPSITASPAAYALVGMAAVNGACTMAPLSAIIVLFELTNEYGIILPLMFTVVIATFITRKLSAESIYTEQLRRKGIMSHHGEDLNIVRMISVKNVLRNDEVTISENAKFDELVRLALDTHRNNIFVIDNNGKYNGAIQLLDLKYVLSNPKELSHIHHIVDFINELPPVSIEESLDTVIDRFAGTGFDRLPVVDSQQILVGSVIMSDIIRRYNQEVANRNITIELGARIPAHDKSNMLHIGGNSVIAEIEVPGWMVGKALEELRLRTLYNISVFLVKGKQGQGESKFITPNATYVFRDGDTILIGGTEKDIETLRYNTLLA
ncbi:MAG: chloride channel protein [Sedimentisphaerales bacterium]|nr:chloride channel protein [Sedimentisphaerales bacterium]